MMNAQMRTRLKKTDGRGCDKSQICRDETQLDSLDLHSQWRFPSKSLLVNPLYILDRHRPHIVLEQSRDLRGSLRHRANRGLRDAKL